MTRAEIRAAIRATLPVEYTNIPDTTINLWINQTMQEIGGYYRWPFLEGNSDISVTANTAAYALPADFAEIKSVHHKNVQKRALKEVSPEFFFDRIGGGQTTIKASDATHFFIQAGQINLYPTPSTTVATKYNLKYFKTITELATDGAEPQFLRIFHWLVVRGVQQKLSDREILEGGNLSGVREDRFILGLERMKQFYRRAENIWLAIYGDGAFPDQDVEPNIDQIPGPI